MVIEIEERGPGICAIILKGEVDYATSPQLRSEMTELFRKDLKQIVVDLSRVDYIDSSGIATLIEGQRQSKRRGFRFTLAEMSPRIEAAFDLANVRDIFKVISPLESAFD